MKDLFVFDSFKTMATAELAANKLVEIGVPRQAIMLGAENDVSSDTDFQLLTGSDLAEANDKDETNIWDRIVGIFQSEDDGSEAAIAYEGYRSALALGDILLLVEEEFRLMIDNTVEVKHANTSQLPTEADARLDKGGSFASEDLPYHDPNDLADLSDLAAPLKARTEDEPLG